MIDPHNSVSGNKVSRCVTQEITICSTYLRICVLHGFVVLDSKYLYITDVVTL